MVDELAVTNEIWRKWNDQKIILTVVPLMYSLPPMTWADLRKKVEEYVKAGKDPYDILREPPRRSKEGIEKKGFETKPPWPNPEPEAVVEATELVTFADWLLSDVRRVWRTKTAESRWEWLIEPTEKGVLVGLRGVSRPHELFPRELIDSIRAGGEATFYFENMDAADRARTILHKHGLYYTVSIVDGSHCIKVDEPDRMLEILAFEGFDTSKIMVER